MQRHGWWPRGIGLLAIAFLLGSGNRWLLAADAKPVESPRQTAAQLASVARQLDALAVKFDADKNQALSPQEQDELAKFVAANHGQPWADRLQPFLRTADADRDGTIDLVEWKLAIKNLGPPPAAGSGKEGGGKETIMVAMSDGVRLATDVYRPDGDGPFPVIFTRTPYSRAKYAEMARGRITEGYVVVSQDMRGRFDSEGENLPFFGCGWGEHKDGVDSIAWIRQQPWCNGKIGTIGGSAGGITQNFMAGAAPEGLTAQHIAVAAADMYSQATYVGGALRKCQVEGWNEKNRFDPKALEIIRAHPAYDDYWRTQDTTTKFAIMNVPAMHIGGWFDTFAQGTIDSFVGRQHEGAAGARGKQKLVMGPWTHSVGRMEGYAELRFPNPQPPKQYESGRWLAYHLKGVDNGIMSEPAVAYYVMGDTRDPKAPGNQWRQADDWPIPSRATPYYFESASSPQGGGLTTDKPGSEGAPVAYTFDPADPCPTVGGNNLTIPRGPMNQNRIESRPDVVLFTTDTLAEPLEVTGRLMAKVFVSSSAVDSDLSIRLCDVYPDGNSYNVAEGMLRLRYRRGLDKPEPLLPGEIVEATVDCWSTSIIFNRGHRLRVTVTSSNHPRFDVNPGTGKPWVAGEPAVKQTNRIFCDAAHPSHILLPIVFGPSKG